MLCCDRKSQAATPTVARRIRRVEALEDPFQPILRDAGAAIRNGHDDLSDDRGRGFHANLDRGSGRMLSRVVEQVPEDPLEAPGVGVDDQPLIWNDDGRLLQPGPRHGGHEPPDIDGFERDPFGSRIESGTTISQYSTAGSTPGGKPVFQWRRSRS